ncbi:MAG: hypothetical protein SPI30_06950 [Prevotella sp.]|nr:hypothetical protein [Prevotella sp.]
MRKTVMTILSAALALHAMQAAALPCRMPLERQADAALSKDGEEENGVWRKTLVVNAVDGVSGEYLLGNNTKVEFGEARLMVTTNGTTFEFDLEKMKDLRYGKMWVLSVTPAERDGGRLFELTGESVIFRNLPAASVITIVSADGKTVSRQRVAGGEYRLSTAMLGRGIYVLKVNELTYKIRKS